MHHLEVPVIVVFTKYAEFMRDVKMDMSRWDYPERYADSDVSEVAEQRFQEHYLRPLGDHLRYVRFGSGFTLKWQVYILLTLFDRNAHAR
jgi:hypothetical protein